MKQERTQLDTTDYGKLGIKIQGKSDDGTPYGRQKLTGNKIEFRLIDQKSGQARHAVNTSATLLGRLFNRGMLAGKDEDRAQRRLNAGEQLQGDFEATGNRPQTGSDYSPTKGSVGDPVETERERKASLRYHAAIDQLTQWEWRCVRSVCIDDQMIDGLDLRHLSLGLDKLIDHYFR